MKKVLQFLLLLTGLTTARLKVAGQLYFDNTIFVADNMPANVLESVKDMAYWLQKATGKKFVIQSGEGGRKEKSIQLLWANKAGLSKALLAQLDKDGQSFYLTVNEREGVRIIGTGLNSFNNGIYTFLHELGFRWYMPGDTWTIVPATFKKKINISKVYTPDFRDRFYAGTGGVNAIAGTDPKNTFRQDYNLWNRRNRFSTDYKVKGHSGHLFYNAYKKIFDANPSWFCHGKRNWYGRMDISNPEVVRLFTEWALTQVKPGEDFPTIGVDPSDGAGGKEDCLPANIPGIKTWSDKYFWLANQVAAKLDKKDRKTQVQLYAYANHAAPPAFALEKNVYPIIIPYAFQRLTSANNFIKLWSDKMDGRPMGIYDYWNITQWSSGVPQFNIYSIPEKFRLWKQYNITSINLETTNGKGAMGHTLWLASQMMWNTRFSFDSLYQDFLATCFGPAAPDIKRMYDRWSRNYQEEMEVNLSLHDLAAASSKTKNPAIVARLNELKAYVHYLKLFYEFQSKPSSPEAFEKIRDYIHAIHGLRLVQSSALLERYIKAPKNFKAVSDKTRDARALGTSAAIIEDQFKQDIKEHGVNYAISDFHFDIKKAKPITGEKQSNPRYLNGRNVYQFFLSSAEAFEIKVGSGKGTKLIIADASKTWVEQMIPASKDGYTIVKVKLPQGSYTLSFGDFDRFSRIIFPSNLVFVSSGMSYYDNAGYPSHYIYVPSDVNAIVYEDKLGPGVNKRGYWINPDGKRINAQKIRNSIYQVPVPLQYRGKVWTLVMGHRSFQMLNIPNVYSIRKFQYPEK